MSIEAVIYTLICIVIFLAVLCLGLLADVLKRKK